jgi:hypothetical protein
MSQRIPLTFRSNVERRCVLLTFRKMTILTLVNTLSGLRRSLNSPLYDHLLVTPSSNIIRTKSSQLTAKKVKTGTMFCINPICNCIELFY